MIRLIASDMDGTLLDSNRNLPPDFDEMMAKLYEREIYFAVASGRSYATLKEQFQDYLEELIFICDNGAYVVYQQELIGLSLLSKENLGELVQVCRSFDGKMLLCGMQATYHEYFGTEEAEEEINHYYVNQVLVEDNAAVEDGVFKIALYDEKGSEEHAYPILKKQFGNRFTMQISGKNWIDIMNADVNKGTALRMIQERMGILPEETMAFGDYMNDYELLQQAKESFAMANAHPQLKKVAAHIAKSNDEQGVMEAIWEYVGFQSLL